MKKEGNNLIKKVFKYIFIATIIFGGAAIAFTQTTIGPLAEKHFPPLMTVDGGDVDIDGHIVVQREPYYGCGHKLTDYRDGNDYKTVLIDNYCWFAEDLRYNDGCYTGDPTSGGWSGGGCADQGVGHDGLLYQFNLEYSYGEIYSWNNISHDISIPGAVESVAFTSDENVLVVGHSGTNYVHFVDSSNSDPSYWTVATNTHISLGGVVYSVAFTSDDSVLVICNSAWGDQVKLIDSSDPDPSNWTVIDNDISIPGSCYSAMFNPDDSVLVLGHIQGNYVTFVDTSDPDPLNWDKVTNNKVVFSNAIRDTAFTSDGSTLVLVNRDSQRIKIVDSSNSDSAEWDVVTNNNINLPGDGLGVTFTPDDKVIVFAHVVSSDTPDVVTVDSSDTDPSKWVTFVNSISTHVSTGSNRDVTFSSDGNVLVIAKQGSPGVIFVDSSDSNASNWNKATNNNITVPYPYSSNAALFTSDTRFLVLGTSDDGGDNRIMIIDTKSTYESTSDPCPDGWHIPTDEEWKLLEGHVDTTYNYLDAEWDGTGARGDDVGDLLKDISEGWCFSPSCGGFGFGALPGGYRLVNGTLSEAGSYGSWWTSTEDNHNIYIRRFTSGASESIRLPQDKSEGHAIRCFSSNCGNDFYYEGHNYSTVKIGDQCWFAEDLLYDDGCTENTWNDSAPFDACDTGGRGALSYQFGAATAGGSPQGLCPPGWRIPSDEDFSILSNYVSSNFSGGRGDQMKDPTEGWCFGSPCGETGWDALPGGYRYTSGSLTHVGSNGHWWSSSVDGGNAWNRVLNSSNSGVDRYSSSQAYGYSVRCLRN